jgi:protein-tyrosine kinase
MERLQSIEQRVPHSSRAPQLMSAPSRASEETWRALRPLELNWAHLRKHRIVADSRSVPSSNAFDVMRTKVLRILEKEHLTSVAITSPTSGCGKSVVTLNLAFSLARIAECRTVVFDLDFHRSRIRSLLKIKDAPPMEEFLSGRCALEKSFLRWRDNLAFGVVKANPTGFGEFLQSASTQAALTRLQTALAPNVILFDLPPAFGSDEVLAFCPNVDSVLIVADAGRTTLAELDACERELAKEAHILGIVLNKCRYMPNGSSYY